MSDHAQVTASPDCPNIYYEVKWCRDIDTNFLPLITTLREKVINTPRVLVYTASHLMYMYIHVDVAVCTLYAFHRYISTVFLLITYAM